MVVPGTVFDKSEVRVNAQGRLAEHWDELDTTNAVMPQVTRVCERVQEENTLHPVREATW